MLEENGEFIDEEGKNGGTNVSMFKKFRRNSIQPKIIEP